MNSPEYIAYVGRDGIVHTEKAGSTAAPDPIPRHQSFLAGIIAAVEELTKL